VNSTLMAETKGQTMRTIARKSRASLALLGFLALASREVVTAQIRETMPVRVPTDEAAAPLLRLPQPKGLHQTQVFANGRNIHTLGVPGAEEIERADREAFAKYGMIEPGPKRVGLVRSVEPQKLVLHNEAATRFTQQGGGMVWLLAVRSPGALGLRIHLKHFDVGKGSAIVYADTPDGLVARGPFTGKGPSGTGEFWTASLPGDTAFIEVSGPDEPQLEVAEVVHFDKLPGNAQEDSPQNVQYPCHLDVMCFGDDPLVNPVARDAVGQMNYISGGQNYVCTGTLLNDLDDDTFMPYFLTAHHCLSTQAEVDTLEVIFGWQKDGCGGRLPDRSMLPRMTGGTLLATERTYSGGNDMTFIRLNGTIPPGVGLAGWTTDPAPVDVVGIHHPNGDWKRVSFMHETTSDLVIITCSGTLFPSQYHYCYVDSGMTEGGSSGSGLFNAAGQVMGQLYGTCCVAWLGTDCAGANCGNRDDWRAVYGEFEETFPNVRRWLEMGGTIHVNRAYSGTELGTAAQPFNTVTEANNFAWDGTRIKIRTASYPEALTFNKRLTLLADGGPVTIGR